MNYSLWWILLMRRIQNEKTLQCFLLTCSETVLTYVQCQLPSLATSHYSTQELL